MSELYDAEKKETSAELIDEGPENIKENKPASQAILDLEASGLTLDDMAATARAAAGEAEKKTRPAPLVSLPRFHWLVLLLLSAGGSLALAWPGPEAPGNIRLWGIAGLILLLLLMSVISKARSFLRLPTRGGLAAALFSAAIFIQTLRGQPENFFQASSMALAWAGLLTLVILWAVVALIRKVGRHALTVLGGVFLVYSALSPVTAMIGHFSPGGPELTWETLNSSPAFLTGSLPWPLWPMALLLGLALPLAALLAFGDLWSSLRRPGARHGGNFFLAMAWLGLIPSGLLMFPPVVDNHPDLIKKVRWMAPVMAGEETAPPAIPALPVESLKAAADADATETTTVTAEPPEPAPAPITPTPETAVTSENPPPTAPEASTARIEELQLRIDDLEGQLQLLSDRLNQFEKPEQPHDLPTPTVPDQPLNTPPDGNDQENDWESYNYGGAAT
jgi:hypothetical protein